jgi:antitoxin FitA
VASITIRDLDERLKARLRVRAAEHNRSMEEEARAILKASLYAEPTKQPSLVSSIRKRLKGIGGVELDLPTREPMRSPFGDIE